MTLKDVDALRKPIYAEDDNATGQGMSYAEMDGYNEAIDMMWNYISSAPTIDAVPVVYGRWGTGRFNLETGNYEEQCTRCRNFSKEYGKPYCPNCGARMDLEAGG